MIAEAPLDCLNRNGRLVAISVLVALVTVLALLIVQARNELASVHRNRLLIRFGLRCYVSVGKAAILYLREFANTNTLNVRCSNEVPLETEPALAIAVVEARNTITSLNGSTCYET